VGDHLFMSHTEEPCVKQLLALALNPHPRAAAAAEKQIPISLSGSAMIMGLLALAMLVVGLSRFIFSVACRLL
jgi:hypothetical protein